MDASQFQSPNVPRTPRSLHLQAMFLLAAIFFAYGWICYPIPSVGEPYYLGKAKHFWQPDWCANDLFLQSANTHLVFYVTCGWLTLFAPLPLVAIVLRLASMILLADGWLRFGRQIGLSVTNCLLWAGLFLSLQLFPSFAGEWLIGGAESKLISYALLLDASAFLFASRSVPASVCLGGAIAFHPIVGLWGALTIAFAAICTRSGQANVALWFRTAVGSFLVALPGLVPGFAVLSATGLSEKSKAIADYIQVFHRLRHHLDPNSLLPISWIVYAVMCTLLAILWKTSRREFYPVKMAVLGTFVFASVGAAIGFAIHPANYDTYALLLEQHPILMKLAMLCLKVYPFRVFDLAVPFLLSLLLANRISKWIPENALSKTMSLILAAVLIGAAFIPMDSKNPSFLPPKKYDDWLATCQWCRDKTSKDSVFVMPYVDWAFHWFASRAQYVSYKNMPQDSARLLEWNRRLRMATEWRERSFQDDIVTREELFELAEFTNADYLITDQSVSFPSAPAFTQGDYQVFSLR